MNIFIRTTLCSSFYAHLIWFRSIIFKSFNLSNRYISLISPSFVPNFLFKSLYTTERASFTAFTPLFCYLVSYKSFFNLAFSQIYISISFFIYCLSDLITNSSPYFVALDHQNLAVMKLHLYSDDVDLNKSSC